jgi:hypothetical protein
MRALWTIPLLSLTACASLQLAGADIAGVDQERVRAAFSANGFRASQINERELKGDEARKYLRRLGVKLKEKRQYSARVVDFMGDRHNAQGRITIVTASDELWTPKEKARIDHVSGSAHWGDGRLQVEAWCLNYERDNVDPACATELLAHLVKATGGAGLPK